MSKFEFSDDVYCFALSGKTRKIMYGLKNIDHSYGLATNNFEQYLEILLHSQPKFVLGLGSYSGVDNDKIRIERVCTNKFGNTMGNSWCNKVSYQIMKLIESGELKSEYTFLQIPRAFENRMAIKQIENLIDKIS